MSEGNIRPGPFVVAGVIVVLAVGASLLAYTAGDRIETAHTGNGAAAPSGPSSAPGTPVQASANGAGIYGGNCAGCHGANGEGAVGPKLAGLSGYTQEVFAAAVLDGKGPGGKALGAMMPHFSTMGFSGKKAEQPDLDALFDYLKGL